MLSFSTAPKNICILRLSAIGDICHSLPVIRTIQSHWPETKITWIIGKTEYNLIKGIPEINFIIFDKTKGFNEYLNLRNQLKPYHFEVLLHMQVSLRSSIASLMVKAKYKIGFDKQRAKDGQWLFTNKKIAAHSHQHVIDSLFGFSEALGISDRVLAWNIPIDDKDLDSAKKLLGNISKYIIISPCSSKAYRNWTIEGYAALADYIKEKYDYDVILTGGLSSIESEFSTKISHACLYKPLNLIGKTNLKELLVVINGATCMISPDSGPAHMSTAMEKPIIGLYAATNPDRARPYLSADLTVNRYPDAIEKKYHKQVKDMPWGTRVRDKWAMQLITIDDTKNMVDKLMQLSL